MKGNKPIVNRALLGSRQLILKVLRQTCVAFYSVGFIFFKSSLRKGTDRIESFYKTHLKKNFEHAQDVFQQIRHGRVVAYSITII